MGVTSCGGILPTGSLGGKSGIEQIEEGVTQAAVKRNNGIEVSSEPVFRDFTRKGLLQEEDVQPG